MHIRIQWQIFRDLANLGHSKKMNAQSHTVHDLLHMIYGEHTCFGTRNKAIYKILSQRMGELRANAISSVSNKQSS